MELFQANAQWSSRPDDQRFTSTQALHDATFAYAKTAIEKEGVRVDSLHVEAIDGDVQVIGKGDIPARLTHWSFGQLAARVGAPANYLRDLPAELAAKNLNHGLVKYAASKEDKTANLLFHLNGSLLLRSINGERYSRIWNFEIAERLLDMESQGWTPATPDIRRKSDDVNDSHNYSLYASDHDLFAFIMHPDRIVKEAGNALGLKRGLIARNSEVGGGKLRLMRFLYREMCGNHIIWGAEDVVDMSAVHVGDIRSKFAAWKVEIMKYLDESPSEEEAMIQHAQTKRIAGTKEELLDALFGKRTLQLSRKVLTAGYDAVKPEEDGDPLTPWGITQGLTRYSQTTPYADERTAIDRAAGKILEAF